MLAQPDGISKTDWSFIPRVMSLYVLKLNSDPEKRLSIPKVSNSFRFNGILEKNFFVFR
jgi:hypothetical protein